MQLASRGPCQVVACAGPAQQSHVVFFDTVKVRQSAILARWNPERTDIPRHTLMIFSTLVLQGALSPPYAHSLCEQTRKLAERYA